MGLPTVIKHLFDFTGAGVGSFTRHRCWVGSSVLSGSHRLPREVIVHNDSSAPLIAPIVSLHCLKATECYLTGTPEG